MFYLNYITVLTFEKALRQYALTELDGKKMIAEKGRLYNKLDVAHLGKLNYPMRKEIKNGWDSPTDGEQYIWGKVDNKEDGYSKKEENIFEKFF